MKHNINHKIISDLLNNSTKQIAPATLEKLRIARSRALEHQRTRHNVPVLAWLGHHDGKDNAYPASRVYNWFIAILFIVVLLSGASFWHSYTEHDISDDDIAILTDDLPMHELLDQ